MTMTAEVEGGFAALPKSYPDLDAEMVERALTQIAPFLPFAAMPWAVVAEAAAKWSALKRREATAGFGSVYPKEAENE